MSKATARGWVFFFQKPREHRNKTVNGVGVLALGVTEVVHRKGVEGPKRKRMPVNNHQGRLVTHGPSLARHLPGRQTGVEWLISPDLDPELIDRLVDRWRSARRKNGNRVSEAQAEKSVATMPVEGNRQVVGLLHGGAHVVSANRWVPCRPPFTQDPAASPWESKLTPPTRSPSPKVL
jgi:hypothetical protein